VTFLDGTTVLGSAPIVNGLATLTLNTLSGDTHSLSVSYAGNADYLPIVSPTISYTVIDPLVLFVRDVYLKVLQRQADQAGVTFWVADIRAGKATRYDVAFAIEQSQESRAVDVQRSYVIVFGRNVDPTGANYWVNQLVSGALNEGTFTAALFNSPEYLATHSDLNAFINSVFQSALGRPATASDLAFFTNLVQSGQGTRSTVVLLILGTPESYQQAVAQVYVEFLVRSPDGTGLSYFVGKILGGYTPTQLAAAILASDEFFADAQQLAPT
jgi:hypothetical protein